MNIPLQTQFPAVAGPLIGKIALVTGSTRGIEVQIDGQARAHGISVEQVVRDALLARQPNKRFATVQELGALTTFLAGEAAGSITGVALPVDGGWTAH